MRKFFIVITLLFLITNITAHAQWRSDTHDVYNALKKPADITIDGELDDDEGWEGVFESVTGTNGKPFCGVEFEDEGAFEEHNGGKWSGPDDHETCFAIVWDTDAIYIAISVTDDEHEHQAGVVHNGDSVQLAFEPTGKREPTRNDILINIALDHEAKNVLLLNEVLRGNKGLVEGDDVAIVRNENEKETYYEIKIIPDNLGINGDFEEGYEFGFSICANDGDSDTPGQKGWSGWYPHAIVHGKNPDKTGLVRLSENELAVEARNKLTTTWGRIKASK